MKKTTLLGNKMQKETSHLIMSTADDEIIWLQFVFLLANNILKNNNYLTNYDNDMSMIIPFLKQISMDIFINYVIKKVFHR